MNIMDKNLNSLARQNIRLARRMWEVCPEQIAALKVLTKEARMSIAMGDLRLLNGNWYVTHTGLVRLARRNRCAGINVLAVRELCQPNLNYWVFEATVFKARGSKGFVGYGDADPSTSSPLMRGAEMRIAETRAVNRALRKAYGIGLCSVEELGIRLLRVDPMATSLERSPQPMVMGLRTANQGSATSSAF